MRSKCVIIVLLIFPFLSQGQFQEDFASGSLDPTIWLGDTMNFTVNGDEELQLMDEDPLQSTSTLYTEVSTGDSTNWEFYYRQEFSASGSNFAKIYLSSTASNFSGDLNGYFIRLGGITGNADRIELYRQSGSDVELLIGGQDSLLAADPSIGRVKVSRDNNNLWSLSVDYTGGTNFVLQGTATDTFDYFGNYFGFYCQYTSGRADKFFFDDISIDPLYIDTRPPQAIAVQPLDAFQLEVLFDEPLNPSTAENPASYVLDPSINITAAEISSTDEALVTLTLGTSLVSQQTYQLGIRGVEDKNGNAQNTQDLNFTFYLIEDAEAYDLLITEIYPDFSPSIGLPETEYLEIFNNSNKIINLQDFILTDNNADFFLPEKLFFPEEYLILYKAGTGDFSAFGDSLPMTGFPTLGNTFDNLVLSSPEGTIIHTVFYTKSWYQNSDKSEGGWSLEMINPRDPCSFIENWRAAENPIGGTPGQENSIFNPGISTTPLNVIRIYPPFGGNQLQIFFNKAVDLTTAESISSYRIEGININSATVQGPQFDVVTLQLDDFLQPATVYTLTINTSLTDCAGVPIPEELNIDFGLPETYQAGDLIINEILFNPYVGGVDFLELYNSSQKVIDLSNLFVANRDTSLQINQVESISTNYLLLPGEYVVLTPDPENIKSNYIVENPKAMIAMSLPSFPDDEGTVVLYLVQNSETIFIDEFAYQEDFHNPLLDNEDGVSLERILADQPTENPENWHSAAESVGFATPTYRNSQYSDPLSDGAELITIPYTTFSPNSDGYRDFLSIQYQTPESGFLANIKVFDTKGRLVRELSQNELLGTQGILQWDGTDASGVEARLGIYLLWVELFHPDGTVEYFKKNCVLAKQLN